jgi:hypothetical protein
MMDNKFKVQTSAGKLVASVFWDSEGILSVEFLKRGAMIFRIIYTNIKEV